MTQDGLLKLIAETAYNVGYGAKKHLSTFDIVEKVPGWIGFISFAVGVLALYVPEFEKKHVSAAFLIFGVASLYMNFYQNDKEKYVKVGSALTAKFHELRELYHEVKSQLPTADMTPYVTAHRKIQDEALNLSVSKQIFLSDWYAHLKFFGQMQIDWVDEQLKFGTWRDKVPFSAKLTIIIAGMAVLAPQLPAAVDYVRSFCG